MNRAAADFIFASGSSGVWKLDNCFIADVAENSGALGVSSGVVVEGLSGARIAGKSFESGCMAVGEDSLVALGDGVVDRMDGAVVSEFLGEPVQLRPLADGLVPFQSGLLPVVAP